jgi:hypothetical protein
VTVAPIVLLLKPAFVAYDNETGCSAFLSCNFVPPQLHSDGSANGYSDSHATVLRILEALPIMAFVRSSAAAIAATTATDAPIAPWVLHCHHSHLHGLRRHR